MIGASGDTQESENVHAKCVSHLVDSLEGLLPNESLQDGTDNVAELDGRGEEEAEGGAGDGLGELAGWVCEWCVTSGEEARLGVDGAGDGGAGEEEGCGGDGELHFDRCSRWMGKKKKLKRLSFLEV